MEVSSQFHVPAALPPRGKDHDTHWIGDWVGTRAGLEVATNRITSCPAGNRTPVVHHAGHHYID
jgi:hypothetical protein